MVKADFVNITPLVQWHEGMMLSPHHFQQNDIRFHQVLSHQLKLLSYYHWGVQHLKLDPITLPDGIVRVLELEALMPDGLIVQYNASHTDLPPLEIDLTPFKPETPRQEIIVQLALPEYQVGISSPLLGDLPRYISTEDKNVFDINTDDTPISVPRLQPKLFLHIGEHPPARCLSFPFLRMIFVDGAFLSVNYTPPCFFVEKNSPLWESVANVCQRIREKAIYLSEKWQNQVGTPMLQETSAILRCLVTGLPSFETMVHGDPIHPYRLYMKICEIVGLLAPLRLSQVPPVLPSYDHNNIDACFSPVLELIQQYLHSIEVSFTSLIFNQKDRLFYLKLLQDYSSNQKLYVGIRAPKGMTETDLCDWFADAVIACDFSVDMVRDRRITGAPRRILSNEELYELMPSRGVVIFEIETDPLYINSNQNINIFNPADTPDRRPIEMVMYVRKVGESE